MFIFIDLHLVLLLNAWLLLKILLFQTAHLLKMQNCWMLNTRFLLQIWAGSCLLGSVSLTLLSRVKINKAFRDCRASRLPRQAQLQWKPHKRQQAKPAPTWCLYQSGTVFAQRRARWSSEGRSVVQFPMRGKKTESLSLCFVKQRWRCLSGKNKIRLRLFKLLDQRSGCHVIKAATTQEPRLNGTSSADPSLEK